MPHYSVIRRFVDEIICGQSTRTNDSQTGECMDSKKN